MLPVTGRIVGLYGFGAAAHLLAQIAREEGRRVFAFVRPGDADAERFALELERNGPADPTRCLQRRWMPRFCSRPQGSWCPPRCRLLVKLVVSCALASI